MPQVDVITPSIVQRAAWLEQAMESVRRQTHKGVGHLVGLDEHGIGPGFMRNELVKKSSAEWLVFLDDDDLLDDPFVEWHLDAAKQQKTDLVYAPCRYPPGAPWRPPISRFDPVRLRSANYIPVTVMIRRRLFDSVGGFRVTAPYEDWNLWLAILDSGYGGFGYFSHVCWTYRLHAHPWRPWR
jgi:glycosyltransferase involved in cell wall biosynthesis